MSTSGARDEDAPAACFRCGARRDPADPGQRLAWVADFDQGTKRWLCPSCARQHVRDIEGKLPGEYW
ncbi:hypothetical protein [Amycolatopsis aidingensis]|uniref:hypothetical protein n=1 Tax=Amycolatopsis aidingensis TaxID=2842453 RepID=UPI001C0AB29B|nr:hypothetical protein [Amycolatopsis aidingensis]